MTKGRLEEIENEMVEFRQFLALVTGHNDILNKAAHIHEIVIKQAERLQEWKYIAKWQHDEKIKLEKFSLELENQNKRYRERVAQLINYIEMTDDETDRQVHKIHVILDSLLEGEE